jgi:hypothetical protein
MEYLKRKGKLSEFIEAKISGQDVVAKWHLLESAKEDIDVLETELREKQEKRDNIKISRIST